MINNYLIYKKINYFIQSEFNGDWGFGPIPNPHEIFKIP